MNQDPIIGMADNIVRLLVVEAMRESVKVLMWTPVWTGLVVLHIWLTNRWGRR